VPSHAFRILVVDDDEAHARLTRTVLQAARFTEVAVVGTAADALRAAPDADLVLLDVQLPDGNGIEVLRRLRERSARPAVVIVTAHGAEAVAAEALRLGADDYMTKKASFTTLLPSVVEHVRRTVALRDELEAAEREVVDAERRTAVGEMTVALHHELNNPLMAALTETALLLEEGDLSPSAVRGLGVIKVALERIRTAVQRAGEVDAAKHVEYIAGSLRMIDLDAPAVSPGLLGRALIVAEDAPLRRLLSVLLRRPGFETESFHSLDEIVARLTVDPVPTVVVVAGISSGDTDPLGVTAPTARRSWALVTLAAPGTVPGALARVSDLALTLPFDPATFGAQVVAATAERRDAR
jgi:DNA-binding response OmpR family regulator